jgi:hypothetical protein
MARRVGGSAASSTGAQSSRKRRYPPSLRTPRCRELSPLSRWPAWRTPGDHTLPPLSLTHFSSARSRAPLAKRRADNSRQRVDGRRTATSRAFPLPPRPSHPPSHPRSVYSPVTPARAPLLDVRRRRCSAHRFVPIRFRPTSRHHPPVAIDRSRRIFPTRGKAQIPVSPSLRFHPLSFSSELRARAPRREDRIGVVLDDGCDHYLRILRLSEFLGTVVTDVVLASRTLSRWITPSRLSLPFSLSLSLFL